MIAVLAALSGELAAFAPENAEDAVYWKGGKIVRVMPDGYLSPILICVTGPGKVLAAAAAQKVIDLYHPEALFFIGICGALTEDLSLGDLVIVESAIQHDFSAGPLGYPRGEIAGTGIVNSVSDTGLVRRALEAGEELFRGRRVVTGRGITGDCFFSPADKKQYVLRRDVPAGDIVDMEGAAAGIVCSVNGVPFLLIRIVSDTFSGKRPKHFQKFLERQSSALYRLCGEIIARSEPDRKSMPRH